MPELGEVTDEKKIALLKNLDGRIFAAKDLNSALQELIERSEIKDLYPSQLFVLANRMKIVQRVGEGFKISFAIGNLKKPA